MSENLIKDKKLKRKKIISYILSFLLLAILIGILVAVWLHSDVQKIPEGQFKSIVRQEASYWAWEEYQKDPKFTKPPATRSTASLIISGVISFLL